MENMMTEQLKAEIEVFKKECLQLWFCERLTASYTNIDLFECDIQSNGDVLFLREQARQLWRFWQAATAQAAPEGCVVVPKKPTKNMINQGYEAHDGFFTNGAVVGVWEAMIKAAQENDQ